MVAEGDLGNDAVWRTYELDAHRFVDDPAVTREKRQRLANVVRGGRDIEGQARLAWICFFGEVKSESAVVHRLRCIFKTLALRRSRNPSLSTIKVLLGDTGAPEYRRRSNIVLFEDCDCEPSAKACCGWQRLSNPFLGHLHAPTAKAWPNLTTDWLEIARRPTPGLRIACLAVDDAPNRGLFIPPGSNAADCSGLRVFLLRALDTLPT